MISQHQYSSSRQRAAQMIRNAGLAITDEEASRIEVADFGLSNLDVEGAQILTLVQTARLSVKVLVLFPNQTEPEHWHPPVGEDPGKEETVRVLWGSLNFYVPGTPTLGRGSIPKGKEAVYTVRQEIVMHPGDQLTLEPEKKHWFQAGSEGAVLYSFSTVARDALDGFSDPKIERTTRIVEEQADRLTGN